ncbi:MAG: DUF971 domain-containing protein [Planctomycetota bacterium]
MKPRRPPTPTSLDLDRQHGLTVRWSDGRVSIYPVAYLRRMSPSAETRQQREQQAANPLAVLKSAPVSAAELRADSAELVGNYAVRIRFSDGHDTGLYAWDYLRQIDPTRPEGPHGSASPHGGSPAEAQGASGDDGQGTKPPNA